jgi:hypothetical protein
VRRRLIEAGYADSAVLYLSGARAGAAAAVVLLASPAWNLTS